jgi:hypothetical protein
MNKRAMVFAMAAFVATSSFGAEREAKRPWEYTDAERLEKRFDPASIRARWFQHAEENGGVQANAVPAIMDNVVVGRDHPELFMPFELFANLVWRGVVRRGQDDWRARFDEQLRGITDPTAFWAAVETTSQPYIAILRHEDEVVKQISADSRPPEAAALQSEAAQREQCAARAAALDAATKVLGRAVLHRALYELIAPNMATFSPPEHDAAQVAYIAKGCR